MIVSFVVDTCSRAGVDSETGDPAETHRWSDEPLRLFLAVLRPGATRAHQTWRIGPWRITRIPAFPRADVATRYYRGRHG
jgi:hypothetical protein